MHAGRMQRDFCHELLVGGRHDLMLLEELANRLVDPDVLVDRESAVSAAFHGDEPVGDAGPFERLMQTDAVVIGHDRVGIAMDGEHRRQPGAYMGQR